MSQPEYRAVAAAATSAWSLVGRLYCGGGGRRVRAIRGALVGVLPGRQAFGETGKPGATISRSVAGFGVRGRAQVGIIALLFGRLYL
jgi:hypothetical protein